MPQIGGLIHPEINSAYMNTLTLQRDHKSHIQGKLESVTCKEQVLCVGEHDPPAYEHYENRQFFGATQEIAEFGDELPT
jgi:hypothetical protein